MSAKKAGGQKRPRLTHANTKVVDVDANGPFLTWLRRELSGLATELDRPGDNHVFLSDPVGQLGSIYKERIVQPMWLLEMAERARTVYTSLEEFEADLELLCSNCAAFNGRHSHWTQLAEEVLKEGKARSASLRIEQSALLTQYPEEAATLKASALLRLGSHPKASALKATNRFFPAPMTPVAAPRYRVGTTLAVPRAVFEHLLYDWRMREEPRNLMPPNSNWTTREWTVDKIIASFKEALRKRAYIMKKESSSNDVFLSTLTGQINADIVSLLYDHEADVHEKVLAQRQPLVPWTSVYGVEILARLLVKLPSLLQPDTPDDKYTAVILAAEELLQYLDQHWSQIVGYT